MAYSVLVGPGRTWEVGEVWKQSQFSVFRQARWNKHHGMGVRVMVMELCTSSSSAPRWLWTSDLDSDNTFTKLARAKVQSSLSCHVENFNVASLNFIGFIVHLGKSNKSDQFD